MLEKCKSGNHNLVFIYRRHISDLEEDVVRWCNICGSIVIDTESDGRVYPGKVMRMCSPLISQRNKDESLSTAQA